MKDQDQEVARRRAAAKSTRRWCGGRVGRQHTPQIMIPPNHPGYRGECSIVPAWFMSTPIWRDTPEDERQYWWCYHRLICTNCTKVLRSCQPEECPDRTRTEPSDPPS